MSKKLVLSHEVIRVLDSEALERTVGGQMSGSYASASSCGGGCPPAREDKRPLWQQINEEREAQRRMYESPK